ncbi:hypothetical protein [Saccharothrix deserti]|nr:hypothetical protein [Saccharothrix deserti]
MAFVDDEQSVGGLASDGADEPFGVAVGLRVTAQWTWKKSQADMPAA